MEGRVILCLIPIYLIFKAVRLNPVADYHALIVFRALIHELTEEIKGRKHARIVIVDTLSVVQDVLTQDEDEINVCTQIRSDTQRVLHSNDGHQINVTAVHKYIASGLLLNPRRIIQTVVQN